MTDTGDERARGSKRVWRGREVSRVEGLSDAVLGFAITLMVVSLEVPRTYAELAAIMRGLPVFGICFALLLHLWYQHYLFFRRFGLEDLPTILLNSVLLFVILFYVYPLKFLFSEAFAMRAAGAPRAFTSDSEVRWLFAVYGAGLCAAFAVLAAMNWYALRQADRLGLGALERFEARWAIISYAATLGVGALSITLAMTLPPEQLSLAGWAYALLGLTGFVVGLARGLRHARLFGE